MNDELAFLEAIRAAPADDAPRLVYADWLSERGDPRGELIIAQCTIARLEAANDCARADYRGAVIAEALCVKAAEARWNAWLGIPGSCQLVRGLPHTIHGNAPTVREHWPALARVPFSVLRVVGGMRDVASIAALPEIAALATVTVTNGAGMAYALDAKKLAARDAVLVPPFDTICTGISATIEETDPPFEGELPLSVRSFTLDSRFHDVAQVVALLGTTRRPLDRLSLSLREDPLFDQLFEAWPFRDTSSILLRSLRDPSAPSCGHAFAEHDVARSLRVFGTTVRLDDALADALADAPLTQLHVTAGGTLSALERALEHPLHRLVVAGFPAGLIDLLIAKAPPTLTYLALSDIAGADLPRLANGRFSELTELSLENERAPALLAAPELARVPWLLCGETRRVPAPNTWRYGFRP